MKRVIVFLIITTTFMLKVQFTYCQVEVERYTPLGSAVRAYNQIPEMKSKDKIGWSDYVLINYPEATELNAPSATRSYNCHGYAWHLSEGGDRVWIGYYWWQTADEYIYWEDGSYLRLNSESDATKISYYDGNHSAIQTSNQGIYISKWGESPLMQHANNYGPVTYVMNNRNYYAIPQISGDGTICNNDIKLYSVQDFHNVTYTWSTSGNLQINGTNTSRNVSISPTSSANGIETVFLSIYIPEYDITRTIPKNVWVGKPSTPFAISGFPYNGYVFGSDNEYEFRALTGPGMGVNYYNWVIGCGSIVFGHGTDDIIVRTCTAPDYVTMNFDVSIRVGNECGLSDWLWRTGYVVGETGPAYMVYPNPASSEITVALNEKYAEANPEKAHELSINQVRIMDQMGKSLMIKNFSGQEFSVRINISALPKGYYIVKINEGESHTILKE